MPNLRKYYEEKYGVIIEFDGETKEYVAYDKVHGKKGKEICREKNITDLGVTLKLYLS